MWDLSPPTPRLATVSLIDHWQDGAARRTWVCSCVQLCLFRCASERKGSARIVGSRVNRDAACARRNCNVMRGVSAQLPRCVLRWTPTANSCFSFLCSTFPHHYISPSSHVCCFFFPLGGLAHALHRSLLPLVLPPSQSGRRNGGFSWRDSWQSDLAVM